MKKNFSAGLTTRAKTLLVEVRIVGEVGEHEVPNEPTQIPYYMHVSPLATSSRFRELKNVHDEQLQGEKFYWSRQSFS
jgi:hypothetical protein